MIPEGFAQITLKWALSGTTTYANTVFGVDNSLALTAPNLAAAVANKIEAWSLLSPNICNVWTVPELTCKLGPDDTGIAATQPVSFGGSNGGSPATSQVAFLLSKNGLLGGRRGHGRMYLPGVPEAAADGAGVLAGGWQAALSAAGAQLLDLLADIDSPMVLLHSPPADPPEGFVLPDPTVVIGLSASGRVATQRRRLRRR